MVNYGSPFFLSLIVIFVGALISQSFGLNVISRSEWGAKPQRGQVDNLSENPPPYVVIHHSDTPPCTTRDACEKRVRSIQDYHINTKKWSDIGYNFLVGEDGNVYEGRGWGKRGAHSVEYNAKSMGICMIGNFTSSSPNTLAISSVHELISVGVSADNIKSDYKLLGHRQTANTLCPGEELYRIIQTWPNWSP